MTGAGTLHYDPAIAVPVAATTAEQADASPSPAWQIWDSLRRPAPVPAALESDVPPAEVAGEMTQRVLSGQLIEFAGGAMRPPWSSPSRSLPCGP